MKNATTIDSNDTVTTPRAGERLDKKGTLRSLEAEIAMLEAKVRDAGDLRSTVEVHDGDEWEGYTGQINWEGKSFAGVARYGVQMTFDSRWKDVKKRNHFVYLDQNLCTIVQASTDVIRWTEKVAILLEEHLEIVDSADVS